MRYRRLDRVLHCVYICSPTVPLGLVQHRSLLCSLHEYGSARSRKSWISHFPTKATAPNPLADIFQFDSSHQRIRMRGAFDERSFTQEQFDKLVSNVESSPVLISECRTTEEGAQRACCSRNVAAKGFQQRSTLGSEPFQQPDERCITSCSRFLSLQSRSGDRRGLSLVFGTGAMPHCLLKFG